MFLRFLALDIISGMNLSVSCLHCSYDDLKPPTSPSPIPSGQKEVTSGPAMTVEEPEEGNGVAVLDDDDNVKEDPPKDSRSYRSPYFV